MIALRLMFASSHLSCVRSIALSRFVCCFLQHFAAMRRHLTMPNSPRLSSAIWVPNSTGIYWSNIKTEPPSYTGYNCCISTLQRTLRLQRHRKTKRIKRERFSKLGRLHLCLPPSMNVHRVYNFQLLSQINIACAPSFPIDCLCSLSTWHSHNQLT